MPGSVTELVDLLDLEEIEVGLFRGRQTETALQRVFGGQVLAQGLVAASRTVPEDRRLHSMHGYFIRPGRTDLPIVFDVETSATAARSRRGGPWPDRVARSSSSPRPRSTRRGRGRARGHRARRRARIRRTARRRARCCPRRPAAPRRCGSGVGRPGGPLRGRLTTAGRRPGRSGASGAGSGLDPHVRRPLGDDRTPAPGALAYASDLTLLSASTTPHGRIIGLNVQAASIDHAMWFHRPFRADQWLLYDQVSPSASSALGLSTARLFQDGALVCTVAQEGLIRPLRER